MKSLFLSPEKSAPEVATALDSLFPGQSRPWLLLSAKGDAVAYFHLEANGEVQVDISGRHGNENSEVMSVLEGLRRQVGGQISNDDE